jgi:hypothetical protein
MIAALLLSVLPTSFVPSAPPVLARQDVADAEVQAKIDAAGKDVAKLLELAKAFAADGKDDPAKKTYKKIVELDPKHEEAHKALRHHFYDGKWFESYAELSKYRREESAKMKEKGLVRFKDEWVPEVDLPYMNMGWVKSESGKWQDPVETARAKQVEEWKAAGYTYRPDDCTWISPEEKAKADAGLMKCGDQWLDLEKANEFHSQIGQWWQLEGEHFFTWSTNDWQGASAARWYADQIYPDMVRLFGLQPAKKPHFVVLNGQEQYNTAAGGQPPLLPETEGFSSLHGAYFSDAFLVPDQATQTALYLGCGVAYWDRKDERLRAWGPYFVRWAAAQSYVDAVDPSWLAISEFIAAAAGGSQPTANNFWVEKKIPRWLRYGAASYAERYMKDPDATEGANPWALREFAFGELKKTGTLSKLEDIFTFALDLNDIERSSRLYHEAGLVVSFLLDGADGDKKLREKHQAFKAALKSEDKDKAKKLADAVEGLQKELAKNEKDIKKFAGM